MNFLSPLFLIGALAAAGPVIFHLIRRTTRHRARFSSIMFLAPTAPRLTERSRFEHLLLLLLRCLALALLALGFARPFWRKTGPQPIRAVETRRIVVLIDVSASMHRTGLWDQARQRAAAVLDSVGPGDQAAVLLFGRRVTPLVGFEAWKAAPADERLALVSSRLAASTPGWEESHLGNALIAAAEALAEGTAENQAPGPRQIYLVSDLKAGSRLDSLSAFDWPKKVELHLEPVKALHPTNAGLQLIAESPDADRQAAPAVRVRVSNAANSTREQFKVERVVPNALAPPTAAGPESGPTSERVGGNALRPVDIYVPPGQSRVVSLPLPPNPGPQQIVLTGDDEDFDNTVYLAPQQQRHWSAIYFGAEAADDIHAPRFFLERALPDNPHLKVTLSARDPAQPVTPAELEEAKVYFATDILSEGNADQLRGQLLAGKTMLFAPRSVAAAGALARLLALPAIELQEGHPADYAMLGSIDFQHPLFAAFADPHYSDFTKIHVWKYRQLKTAGIAGARVVARFDRGDPALVEVPVGRGRLLILLTGWNPGDSQFAVSSKFVPMIAALLDYAGGPTDAATQFTVGDVLPGGAGSEHALHPGFFPGDHGTVAVNLAASESRTEPMALDELERYGAPGPRRAVDPAQAQAQASLLQAAEAESRQKLWRWLLGATLLVLLVESILAGWTARRDVTGANPIGGTT